MKTILAFLLFALPALPAITLVQSPAVVSGASVTSQSATFSSTPTVGHTIHVVCAADSQSITFTVTDNQGNTYTAATGATINGTYIFSAPVTTASGTFTVTCHLSSSSYVTMGIAEFSGETATPTVDQATHADPPSGTSWSPGSITTTHAPDVIISVCASITSATFTYTPASSYTILGSQTDGNNFVALVWEYQAVGSTGTYTASYTVSPAGDPSGCGVAAYEGVGSATVTKAQMVLQ